MTDSHAIAYKLINWYRDEARAFIHEHASDRVAQLDQEVERLENQAKACLQEQPICFLGGSGVGKSTLLNALVAGQQSVLPAGGIGPLTAQATVVRYSEKPYFCVTYQPAKQLHKVLFALERNHELQLRRGGAVQPDQNVELEQQLDEEDRGDVQVALEPADAAGGDTKLNAYRKQACLLLLGNQFATEATEYLLDGLRECLRQPRRWQAELRDDDRKRIERIQAALAQPNGSMERKSGDDLRAFLRELEDHASGFLAPLVRRLEVGWNADFLRNGLVLVDLPGVGVANDDYRHVTAHWVRRARAVVLVVDRAGVTEADAETLRTTGFFNSLLHDDEDPNAEPAELMVVMVKLDMVADEDRHRHTQQTQERRRWADCFADACNRSADLIQNQLRIEFERLAGAGAENTRAARQNVMSRVLSTLQVHPVCATEYRKLLVDDEDDRPRLREEDQTGIPSLRTALQVLSDQQAARADAALGQLAASVAERCAAVIGLVVAKWQDEQRAQEEAERLRQELQAFVEPLRREFLVRQGAYREFLRAYVPEMIDARVERAAVQAHEEIRRMLRHRYERAHYSVLRAAVRRGGTYQGALHVDLPNDLTLTFEEPVSVVWSKEILVQLRKRTAELGKDYVEMVGHVVQWTREQGTRVRPQLVEALYQDLAAETRGLSTVGKEAIEELKMNVKAELFLKVESKVRARCQRFVEQNLDRGAGVRNRIVDFFADELAKEVVQVAKPAATTVLKRNYAKVNQEIVAVLGKYRNPLDSAVNEIVDSEEARIRRSDAQRRKTVLARAEALREQLPGAAVQEAAQ